MAAKLNTIDNAQVIDFLTSAANILAEHQLLSTKESDNLRIAIGGLHLERKNSSLLQHLFRQKNELLLVLLNRYDLQGLTTNLSNYCLRPVFSDLDLSIGQLARQLLEGSKLYFNRFFYLYTTNEIPEQRSVMSTFLVNLAKQVMDVREDLRQISESTQLFKPHCMVDYDGHQTDIDLQLAASLGFHGLAKSHHLSLEEPNASSGIQKSLGKLHTSLSQFLDQINRNLSDSQDLTEDLAAFLSQLILELQKLNHVLTLSQATLIGLELYRLSQKQTLMQLGEILQNINTAVATIIAKYINYQPYPNTLPPQDLQRALVAHLNTRQVTPLQAQAIIQKMILYCKNKGIEPVDLITAELSKMSSSLDDTSLTIIKDYYRSETQSSLHNVEKEQALETAQGLLAKLNGISNNITAPILTLVFVIFSSLSCFVACGLKTDPVSEVIDVRPSLPFETVEIREPQSQPSTPVKTPEASPTISTPKKSDVK